MRIGFTVFKGLDEAEFEEPGICCDVSFSLFEVGPSQFQLKLSQLTICFGVESKTESFADLFSFVFFWHQDLWKKYLLVFSRGNLEGRAHRDNVFLFFVFKARATGARVYCLLLT